MMRWFAVRDTRVVESDDPVNYRYVDGRIESLAGSHAGNKMRFNCLNPLAAVRRFFCVPGIEAHSSITVDRSEQPKMPST
jgi:hypothetical protein